MKIGILCQEEPIYFSPFIRRLIDAKKDEIVFVAICGSRGAGCCPKTFKQKLGFFYSLWLLFEPRGFLRNAAITLKHKILQKAGLFGSALDNRSIEGCARNHRLQIVFINDPNNQEVITRLKFYQPDIIINQSELLLKKIFLEIPKLGVINCRASLLPRFRGCLASFWAHAAEPPEYGVTINFVNEEPGEGPIIAQEKFHLDQRLSYAHILDELLDLSLKTLLAALAKLEQPGFTPQPNDYQNHPANPFPALSDIKTYCALIKERRKIVW